MCKCVCVVLDVRGGGKTSFLIYVASLSLRLVFRRYCSSATGRWNRLDWAVIIMAVVVILMDVDRMYSCEGNRNEPPPPVVCVVLVVCCMY